MFIYYRRTAVKDSTVSLQHSAAIVKGNKSSAFGTVDQKWVDHLERGKQNIYIYCRDLNITIYIITFLFIHFV
jgi:hypothetical protein